MNAEILWDSVDCGFVTDFSWNCFEWSLASEEKFVKIGDFIFLSFSFFTIDDGCSEKAAQLLWLRLESLKEYKIYFHFCIFFEKCDQGLSQCNFRPSHTQNTRDGGTMSGRGVSGDQLPINLFSNFVRENPFRSPSGSMCYTWP